MADASAPAIVRSPTLGWAARAEGPEPTKWGAGRASCSRTRSPGASAVTRWRCVRVHA